MKKCVCGEEMTPADWKNQWVCHRCGRTKPMRTTVTNADRIRAMSDEELVKMLWKTGRNYRAVCSDPVVDFNEYHDDLMDWLQQPAEEDDHDA